MSGQLFNSVLRRSIGVSFTAWLLLASGSSALGQNAPVSYPPSRALGDIAAWLTRDTPILPAQVVDISPSAVTAVLIATPMGETRGVLTNIAAEAMDPSIVGHDGMASWSIPVEIDCDRRLARLGAMIGFHSRDLISEPKIIREADSAWVTPADTAPLNSVIRALCERDFQRPLVGKLKTTAPASGRLKTTPAAAPAVAKLPEPKPPEPRPSPPKVRATQKADLPLVGTGGGFAVQVGASPSLPDIQGLLVHFKTKFADKLSGLTPYVATVVVDGKSINRALISGFGSAADANVFCKTIAASGQACFVRR